jgi:hypothetical protein
MLLLLMLLTAMMWSTKEMQGTTDDALKTVSTYYEQLYEQGESPAEGDEFVVILEGEDYQNLLEVFDEWEEMFGPIPFWAESRGWQPWRCYEIVPEEEAEIVAGKTGLKRVEVSKKQRDQILEEAKEWVLVADTKEEETLLWHDDDYSVWTSTEEIKDFYKQHVVIRDGHFFGALIEIEDVSSYGMSVNRSSEWGVLFTDGSTDGEIKKYFSHCSTEVDRSEETTYSLKRK